MTQKTRLRLHKENRGRRVIKFALIGILCVLLAYQLDKKFEIVALGKEYYAKLVKTFSPESYIRGTIYDRNLKQLAVTMERVSVFVRTREINSIHETAMLLSTVLQLEAKNLENQLESGAMRLWIAEDISQDQEESLKNLALPGVYLQKDSKRYYPNNFEASHLVGYVEDGFGLSGAEFYYDRILATRKLQEQKGQSTLHYGQDLVLTIDLKIQAILEAIVKDIAEQQGAFRVMAYLQEGRNGEIIAGAHFPSFDPNNFTKYSQDILKNGFLEPIFLPPQIRGFLRDASLLFSKQKKQQFAKVWSLVSPEYDLGSQLQLWNFLGFDDDSLAGFAAQSDTVVKSIKEIALSKPYAEDYGTTPEILTPMQLLNGFTILLGHGKSLKPNIVKKIIDVETDLEVELAEVIKSNPLRNEASPIDISDIKVLYDALAQRLNSSAQYFDDSVVLTSNNDGQISSYIENLTFVKIPSGSEDLFLLVRVQKHPKGAEKEQAGTVTDAAIIDDKAERISVLQQVALTVADVVEPEPFKAGNYQSEQRRLPGSEPAPEDPGRTAEKTAIMPDLVGLSLRKSLRLLDGIEIKIKIEGTGRVVSQSPSPGTSLKDVESCLIVLASKEKEMFEEVPAQQSSK